MPTTSKAKGAKAAMKKAQPKQTKPTGGILKLTDKIDLNTDEVSLMASQAT
jgi:hypothetical protein